MVFNKIKEFVAPVDEDEDEGEELKFTGREVQPVSTYESKQTNLNNISKNTQMVMFEPRSFEQAEEIARHLKQTRGCIINLHRLQREYAQRTIDFLSGVVFALDGTIQKVGHNVIFCAPRNVGVEGNISLDKGEDE